MSRNTNIGRSTANNAGLILQAKPEIDTAESGLKTATLVFNLLNTMESALTPLRGTACSDFISGSARTTAILATLDYLAAQTCKMKRDAVAPGIGQLEVMCMGAVFPEGADEHSIAGILVLDGGSYVGQPEVVIAGDGSQDAVITAIMESVTVTLVNPGTGFLEGDTLLLDGGTPSGSRTSIIVDTVGGSGEILTFHSVDGLYSDLPPTPIGVTGGTGSGATFDVTWEINSLRIDTGGRYTGTPSVSLSGGLPITPGSIGPAIMGPILPPGGGLTITPPFFHSNTVKDTVEVLLFAGGTDPVKKVTIEYRAPEITFEYVSKLYQQTARYLQHNYTDFTGHGEVAIYTPFGTGGVTVEIDSVAAILVSLDANGGVVDGKTTTVTEDEWRSEIKYIGANAQFQQVLAGRVVSVIETQNINIAPAKSWNPPDFES
jgi:hypothetical protein